MSIPHNPEHFSITPLEKQLEEFNEFGGPTDITAPALGVGDGKTYCVPTYTNQFFTDDQRQGSHLHELPYLGCFKPALPRFFIERLTHPEEVVYDPFMGRGTTVIEAALLRRVALGNDLNPLSAYLAHPRLDPPTLAEVQAKLDGMDFETRPD